MRTVRVLLTSPAGRAGRVVAPALRAAGHEVALLGGHDVRARRPVAQAAAGCHAVLHDATVGSAGGVGGVVGTRVVVDVAADVGARAVVVSSAAVLGPREAPDRPALSEWERPVRRHPLVDVERAALGGGDVVVVRPALDPATAATLRGRLLDPGPGFPWQVLDDADLTRFLLLALTPGTPTGLVHVAAQGTVPVAALAAALARPRLRVPARLAPPAVRVPLLDTTRMHLQWDFAPVRDAVQTVEALAR